jgi:hypothetical protein
MESMKRSGVIFISGLAVILFDIFFLTHQGEIHFPGWETCVFSGFTRGNTL